MDDLDHSMHIAEYDWTSFYEESEECGLHQPSLACPDSANLSDSEDSGNSSSVFSTGQKGPQQNFAANSDAAESSAAGCCMEEENYSGTAINTTGHITEDTDDNTTATLQTEQPSVQYSDEEPSELRTEDEDVQMESDIREFKRDPLSCNRAEINVKESHTSDRAVSEDVISVALRGEKERCPETYAEAAGHNRPVYAISAFWDEMEKLTINDILQLRMGSRTPPRETQETVTPSIDDLRSLDDTVEYNLSDIGLMDTSDTADSDYFTQPDESKPDPSSCDFSTSDIEEEYSQFLGSSRNPTPDPRSKKRCTRDSPILAHEEEESTSSEGKETPVPSEDLARKCFEDQDSNAIISSQLTRPRQITKSKSVHNVQTLKTEDLSLHLLLGDDESSLFLSSCPSLEENVVLKVHDSLLALQLSPFMEEHYQIFCPEVFQCVFREDKTKIDFRCVTVYEPKDISVAPVIDFPLWTHDMSFSSLHHFQRSEEKPIPIFSCSHPIVRELTFPNPHYVFLSADCKEEDDVSPFRVVSHSFIQGSDCGAAASITGFHSWNNLMRKIRFPDKGSIWCRRSGVWVFPGEAERISIKNADPPLTALTERRVSFTPSQLSRELAVQQRVLETIKTTRREGIFSTLKQSDMCLVCIAFASWVLTSSDPEAADAWKAALLANVSALSAIQYLRQYVKKKNPS
ncbi:hypothetical protein VZT92_013081 [Zoarces viviparus]|uniref:PGC-1 and ERR-induced regulator in muscle protein 1 n=1 Tax=Zoarces viviparus TaxID=48416 RepID=A0AAW1F3M1_ZOAVI